jgi:hypothetical protein
MPPADKISTHQKALSINLDATIFGSFAEIGAGQEVVRWFLRAGGASGTLAKSISAYDKEVSDDLYGGGTRHVSEPRLEAMLDNEWGQLLSQLHESRSADTRFFTFVDTVSARNYSGTNECHGWMGLRFLERPDGKPNDVIFHVNLQDPSNVLQQEAVGILGVNLIYAAYHVHTVEEFLSSVFDDLNLQRIEIDLVELKGPAFENWDRGTLHASLVTGGRAEAVVFPADRKLVAPTELLYKKAIVLAPGTFETVEELRAQLLQSALAELPKDEVENSKGSIGLFCISTAPRGPKQPGLSADHIVRHVEELQRLGSAVLVFREHELYKMSAFLNRFTKSRVHFTVGLPILVRAFQDRYQDLAGSLLEGVGRLFVENIRLSVFPMPAAGLEQWMKSTSTSGWRWESTDGMVYADHLHPPDPLDHLYQYLIASELIFPLRPASRQG